MQYMLSRSMEYRVTIFSRNSDFRNSSVSLSFTLINEINHQVCIYKYAWNQIIPTWIEFIQSWNEFIPSISNSLPGFNKNKSRAALGAFIRKILFGTSSIYYFWFLEKFLIFNSAKLQFIQEWIHSRMESIHTN